MGGVGLPMHYFLWGNPNLIQVKNFIHREECGSQNHKLNHGQGHITSGVQHH